MLDKLKQIATTYEQLQQQLYDPAVSQDTPKLISINRQISQLTDAYELYQKIKSATHQLDEAKEILATEKDAEMLELAQNQYDEAQAILEDLTQQVQVVLLPKDPNDDRNIFLEIRPAAGGDEAGLFAAELLRMYLRYAERLKRKAELIEHDLNDIGGLKFAMVKISGDKVYSKLKFESGVHRVQRIPETESQGRIHTSTITVAVMPEIDDVEITISPNDLEIDTFAASSAGGQNANKNQTGVRIHHKPSGLIVMGQDCKSQLQNKENAMKVLKARLYQMEMDKQQAEQKALRFDQIGTGDRSEKIRTYNFPQDRVTDHRVKQSRSYLPNIMDGDIDDIMEALIVENQTKMLEKVGEN
ncbi:MAG: peptide chain release factor 1 [bacterium]|nr:peptide chain release factor 1 [bacterium]